MELKTKYNIDDLVIRKDDDRCFKIIEIFITVDQGLDPRVFYLGKQLIRTRTGITTTTLGSIVTFHENDVAKSVEEVPRPYENKS